MLQLLLGLVSSSAPPLKACESVWLPKSLSGDLGGQFFPKLDFGPRSDLVRTSFGPGSNCSLLKLQASTWCLTPAGIYIFKIPLTISLIDQRHLGGAFYK